MMSWVQFENNKGKSFRTDILEEGWKSIACERRLKKKGFYI